MGQVLTKPIPVRSPGASADRPGGGKPMISSTRIARRVRQLGRQISETYADIETPLVIVVILKGATVFAADLLRSLSIPAELEFVRASSYHGGTTSSGRLQLAHMVDGTLLDRPARRVTEVKIDFCGFVIPDRFVIGYGLDYAGLYRELPHIYSLT